MPPFLQFFRLFEFLQGVNLECSYSGAAMKNTRESKICNRRIVHENALDDDFFASQSYAEALPRRDNYNRARRSYDECWLI